MSERRRKKAGTLSIAKPLAGKHVAIVEDNTIIRLGIEQIVINAGGNLVKSVEQHCDVAVLDVLLDRQWALEAPHDPSPVTAASPFGARTVLPIALSYAQRGTPLLFYTGCSEEEIEALQRHFTESVVLRKPATPDKLLHAILSVLGNGSAPFKANDD